jgi:hypothetical protein
MNADLMITIAFCLIVLLGSLAAAELIMKSARDDKAKEAAAKRLHARAEDQTADIGERCDDEGRQELITCKERSSAQ